LAFEVIASNGVARTSLTRITAPAGEAIVRYFQLPAAVDGDKVDLFFYPCPDAARSTVEFTQYWNGTIVVIDQPIAGH
jgi:hypothetical protein